MIVNTNLLVTKRKFISSVVCLITLVSVLSFWGGRSYVRAAQAPAAGLDDASVAPLLALDHAVEAVAARVNPAIVNVAVTARGNEVDAQEQDQNSPFFQFFGPKQRATPQLMHGIGSGAIISPDGYIVTNQHVVDGAVEIRVTLNDRRVLPAKLVGSDKLTDLAVLKVDDHNLPSVPWGDSSKLHPGQTVLAFGSPFGLFQFSVTRGIVSAVNRSNPDRNDPRKPGGFIQTDAAINRGNSGGPLVNSHGEVVGINTFIISDSNSGVFAGAGFAIPAQIAQPTVAALIKDGVVHHGYLGVSISDVTPENGRFFHLQKNSGALISQVTDAGPGAKAGLRSGDIVQQIDATKIDSASDLQLKVSEASPGTAITLHVIRDGSPIELKATVGEFEQKPEKEGRSKEETASEGALGIGMTDLTSDIREQLQIPGQVKGAVVQVVRPGSPAEEAGIGRGDVIQEVNRHPVASASELSQQLKGLPKDADVLLLIWSQGSSTFRVLHFAATLDR